MIALTARSKAVIGALGVVLSAWALDLLTGGPEPQAATAALPTGQATPPDNLPPDPPDLAAIFASLSQDDTPPAPLAFETLGRDLFAPSEPIQAALAPARRQAAPEGLEPQGEPGADEPEALPFEARHHLAGVLTGRVPLALIDGQLLRRGAVIDGYRLVELHRDFVVFERGNRRVILRVPAVGTSGQER